MCPNLYIIAGPNGAGKSLFSATSVDTDFEDFDGDKYISRLQRQFPEIGSDILSNRVTTAGFVRLIWLRHIVYYAGMLVAETKKDMIVNGNLSYSDLIRASGMIDAMQHQDGSSVAVVTA